MLRETFIFGVAFVLGVTVTAVGTVIGILGGIAGFWALWKVFLLSRDLNVVIRDQTIGITAVTERAKRVMAEDDAAGTDDGG